MKWMFLVAVLACVGCGEAHEVHHRFNYGDRVQVTQGFYEGERGVCLLHSEYSGRIWVVFEPVRVNDGEMAGEAWIHPSFLQDELIR